MMMMMMMVKLFQAKVQQHATIWQWCSNTFHKYPQIHTCTNSHLPNPPNKKTTGGTAMDGTFLDWWFHSLGFPNYQYEVSKVEAHPFFAIRHQKQPALVFGEAEARRFWSFKGKEGDSAKKCCTFFVGKRLKFQKLWWYRNSWLQFYDFNSLLQSSKIVLKVGEPSTKMLSTWSMDCTNSIFIKRTSLLFTVYFQFGLVFEVIWASLFFKLIVNPGFIPPKFQSTPAPNRQTTMFSFHHLPYVLPGDHWLLEGTSSKLRIKEFNAIINPTGSVPESFTAAESRSVLFLMSYQMKFNRFKWWIGDWCTREQKYILCIYSLIIYIYMCNM